MTLDDAPMAVIAAVSSALTGITIKAIDFFTSRKTVEVGVEASLRQELRGQVQELVMEVKALRKEVDGWRDKYYVLMDHCGKVENEHDLLQAKYKVLDGLYRDLKYATEAKLASIEGMIKHDRGDKLSNGM